MNAPELTTPQQTKPLATPRKNAKATIPPEIYQQANALLPDLRGPLPISGPAAIKLYALCLERGVSFSAATKCLGLKPSTTFCDYQLGAHFGGHLERFTAVYPKVSRSHYRHLFELGRIDEAVQCLEEAVRDNQGNRRGLTCANLGRVVKAKIAAGAYTPRAKKSGGSIKRTTVTRAVEHALKRAKQWDPEDEVIMFLNEAVRLMRQPPSTPTAQASE